MKKVICGVVLFHVLCFVSMIISNFMQNQSIMAAAFKADIIGAVVCPMILAVAGGISGLRNELSVLKFYPNSAAAVGGIGLVRGVIFAAASIASGTAAMAAAFAGAMKYLLVSFILLTVWFIIFEATRYIMSRGTKYNKAAKKPRKKS